MNNNKKLKSGVFVGSIIFCPLLPNKPSRALQCFPRPQLPTQPNNKMPFKITERMRQAFAVFACVLAAGDGDAREPVIESDWLALDDEGKRRAQIYAMTFAGADPTKSCNTVLIRGPAGSGKSTMAVHLFGEEKCLDMSELAIEFRTSALPPPVSADMTFVIAADDYPGLYDDDGSINVKQLGNAHKWAQEKAVEAFKVGYLRVIAANTFCDYCEMAQWFRIARDHGSRVAVLELDTAADTVKSLHGVPVAKIAEMTAAIKRNPLSLFTPEEVMQCLPVGADQRALQNSKKPAAYNGAFVPISDIPDDVLVIGDVDGGDGGDGGAPCEEKLQLIPHPNHGEHVHTTFEFFGPSVDKKAVLATLYQYFGMEFALPVTGVHVYKDAATGNAVTCLVIGKIKRTDGKEIPKEISMKTNPHITITWSGELKPNDSNRTFADFEPVKKVKKGKKGQEDKVTFGPGPLEDVQRYRLVEPLVLTAIFRTPLPVPK
jgi:predicted kinase